MKCMRGIHCSLSARCSERAQFLGLGCFCLTDSILNNHAPKQPHTLTHCTSLRPQQDNFHSCHLPFHKNFTVLYIYIYIDAYFYIYPGEWVLFKSRETDFFFFYGVCPYLLSSRTTWSWRSGRKPRSCRTRRSTSRPAGRRCPSPRSPRNWTRRPSAWSVSYMFIAAMRLSDSVVLCVSYNIKAIRGREEMDTGLYFHTCSQMHINSSGSVPGPSVRRGCGRWRRLWSSWTGRRRACRSGSSWSTPGSASSRSGTISPSVSRSTLTLSWSSSGGSESLWLVLRGGFIAIWPQLSQLLLTSQLCESDSIQ